jgi:hypothetical protein
MNNEKNIGKQSPLQEPQKKKIPRNKLNKVRDLYNKK